MNKNENILLADCQSEEVNSLAEALQFESQGFCVKSHIANWGRTGKISEIKRYAKYFGIAFRYFICRKRYNAIIGWQQFYTLIFCFYCTLLRVHKQNLVVALNFTYKEKKGKAKKIYRWFMGKCINPQYMDYLHVLSEDYADVVSKEFGFPRNRIVVTPFGVNDRFDEFKMLQVPKGFEKEGYALAIGRSNRDYDFLIEAWEKIDYPLVIISDTYKKTSSNSRITILNHVTGRMSYPWISNCGLMIIPIDDGEICSGDTVLLTAMSLERKIIITIPSTLAEMYVVDGETALFAEKSKSMFKEQVVKALYSQECEELGKRARKSFLGNFSRQSMGTYISKRLNA